MIQLNAKTSTKMKLPIRILLINVTIAIVVAMLISLQFKENYKSIFVGVFGLALLVIGALLLFAGLALLCLKNKTYSQGFLMSSGTILAIGALVCSSSYIRF